MVNAWYVWYQQISPANSASETMEMLEKVAAFGVGHLSENYGRAEQVHCCLFCLQVDCSSAHYVRNLMIKTNYYVV